MMILRRRRLRDSTGFWKSLTLSDLCWRSYHMCRLRAISLTVRRCYFCDWKVSLMTEKSVFLYSIWFVLPLRGHDLFTTCFADERAGLRAAIPALRKRGFAGCLQPRVAYFARKARHTFPALLAR